MTNAALIEKTILLKRNNGYKIIIHYIHKTMILAWDTCVKTCKIPETKIKKFHLPTIFLTLCCQFWPRLLNTELVDLSTENPPTPTPTPLFHRGGSEFSDEARPYNRSKDIDQRTHCHKSVKNNGYQSALGWGVP